MPVEAWKLEVAQRWSALTLPKKEKKEPSEARIKVNFTVLYTENLAWSLKDLAFCPLKSSVLEII